MFVEFYTLDEITYVYITQKLELDLVLSSFEAGFSPVSPGDGGDLKIFNSSSFTTLLSYSRECSMEICIYYKG